MITMAMVCNSLFSFAATTPLSRYSSQWDFDYFKKANTSQWDYFLSQPEKDFIHILNLARISPILFKETVLIPYCDRYGYSSLAYQAINKLSLQPNLPMLTATIYFKKQAKNFLDKQEAINFKQGVEVDSFLKGQASKPSVAYTFSKSNEAVNLILQLLTDAGTNGVIFRDYFSGAYTDVGVFIQSKAAQDVVAAVLLDKLTEQQRSDLPRLKTLDLITFDQPKMILLNEYPNDSLLKYYLKPENSTSPPNHFLPKGINVNTKFVTEDEIEKIHDSLFMNQISCDYYRFRHFVDLPRSNKSSKKYKPISNSTSDYTSSTGGWLGNESDSALDFYYAGRTDDSLSLQTGVTIMRLTTARFEAPFPADSIGRFDHSISLAHVDQYVHSLSKVEDAKLATTLTKPWKTELEKVRAIFMWINKNVSYDYVGLENGNRTYEVKDVLAKRKGVCEGYANLFRYLCEKANIKCYKISGETPRGAHAWNTVRIDNKWYLLDATWGLNYFLMNPDIFIKEHYCGVRKWTLQTSPMSAKDWREKYLTNADTK